MLHILSILTLHIIFLVTVSTDRNCTVSSSCDDGIECDGSDSCFVSCDGGCNDLILNCYSNNNCTINCLDCESSYFTILLLLNARVNLQCPNENSCNNATIVFVNPENSSSTTIIECNDEDSCKSSTMTFAPSSHVIIECHGSRSCQSAIFDASNGDSFDFTASATFAARYADMLSILFACLFKLHNTENQVTTRCPMYSYGLRRCKYLYFVLYVFFDKNQNDTRYVPSNGAGPYQNPQATLNFESNIYCGDEMNIYAFEGFNDMKINRELNGMLYGSYIYCGQDYNSSCQVNYLSDDLGCINSTIQGYDCYDFRLGTFKTTTFEPVVTTNSSLMIQSPSNIPSVTATMSNNNNKKKNSLSIGIYVWVLVIAGVFVIIMCGGMIVLFVRKNQLMSRENHDTDNNVQDEKNNKNNINTQEKEFRLPWPGSVDLRAQQVPNSPTSIDGEIVPNYNVEIIADKDKLQNVNGEKDNNNPNNDHDDQLVEISKSHESLYRNVTEEVQSANQDIDHDGASKANATGTEIVDYNYNAEKQMVQMQDNNNVSIDDSDSGNVSVLYEKVDTSNHVDTKSSKSDNDGKNIVNNVNNNDRDREGGENNIELQIEGASAVEMLSAENVYVKGFNTINWEDWNANDVNKYIEHLLRLNNFAEKEIQDFVDKVLLKMKITGKILKKLKQSDILWNQFQQKIENHSFGIWVAIAESVEAL